MPDTNSDRLLEALEAEFGSTSENPVLLQPNPPATFTAPSVVVTPGDPFLTPNTVGQLGLVVERWEVLVVVSMTDKSVGINQIREISHRVRNSISRAGGRWLFASGPRRPQGQDGSSQILCINTVEFKTSGPTP